jgi:hypothetical protein
MADSEHEIKLMEIQTWLACAKALIEVLRKLCPARVHTPMARLGGEADLDDKLLGIKIAQIVF